MNRLLLQESTPNTVPLVSAGVLILDGSLYVVMNGTASLVSTPFSLVRGSYRHVHTSLGGAFIFPPDHPGPNRLGARRLKEHNLRRFRLQELQRNRYRLAPVVR